MKLRGEVLTEMEYFNYLVADWLIDSDVSKLVNKIGKLLNVVKKVVENKRRRMRIKRELYEGMLVRTMIYGLEL